MLLAAPPPPGEWAPDAVLDVTGLPAGPGATVVVGRGAITDALADWGSAWSSVDRTPLLHEHRGDRELVAAQVRAVGARSGLALTCAVWQVAERRGGRVVRTRLFGDEAAARAAFAGA